MHAGCRKQQQSRVKSSREGRKAETGSLKDRKKQVSKRSLYKDQVRSTIVQTMLSPKRVLETGKDSDKTEDLKTLLDEADFQSGSCKVLSFSAREQLPSNQIR